MFTRVVEHVQGLGRDVAGGLGGEVRLAVDQELKIWARMTTILHNCRKARLAHQREGNLSNFSFLAQEVVFPSFPKSLNLSVVTQSLTCPV